MCVYVFIGCSAGAAALTAYLINRSSPYLDTRARVSCVSSGDASLVGPEREVYRRTCATSGTFCRGWHVETARMRRFSANCGEAKVFLNE